MRENSVSYDQLDDLVDGLITTGFVKQITKLQQLMLSTEHKRKLPSICSVEQAWNHVMEFNICESGQTIHRRGTEIVRA